MTVDIAAIRAAGEKATAGARWAAGWGGDPDIEGMDAAGFGIVAVPSLGQIATLRPNPYGHAKTWEQVLANGNYIAMLDPRTVLALCDLAERALPTAPLAEDVQAAVERVRLWQRPSHRAADADTIIAALQAATADRERLRAALTWAHDALWDGIGGESTKDFDKRINRRAGQPRYTGLAAAIDAALAATPSPDVVVVPKAEYERLKADSEFLGKWAKFNREVGDTQEATDARS